MCQGRSTGTSTMRISRSPARITSEPIRPRRWVRRLSCFPTRGFWPHTTRRRGAGCRRAGRWNARASRRRSRSRRVYDPAGLEHHDRRPRSRRDDSRRLAGYPRHRERPQQPDQHHRPEHHLRGHVRLFPAVVADRRHARLVERLVRRDLAARQRSRLDRPQHVPRSDDRRRRRCRCSSACCSRCTMACWTSPTRPIS